MKLINLLGNFITLFLLVSCSGPTLKLPKSDHYNGDTFFNPNFPKFGKSFSDLLDWKLDDGKKEWPEWVNIEQKKDFPQRSKKGELVITFINHATILIQIDGVNILSDPIYSKRASPVSFAGPKRVKLPGVKFEDLPKIDAVIISHAHYDHFDVETLERVIERDNPRIYAGLGNSYYMDEKYKKNFEELDWDSEVDFNGVKISFLRCKHWSRRTLFDTNKTLWGAYSIVGVKKKVYFAGDTGYDDHFVEAGEKFNGFDVALIPIGAYEPRWFMKDYHINPKEAVMAYKDLNAKKAIGIHFGTFQLTDEAIDDPKKDLKAALEKEKINFNNFIAPNEGQTFSY